MVISGIIRPPPDIRAVADRTALFVSKNGRAFELKILNSEKGRTPKFAFLHDASPFHAYYEDRIRFYDEGGTDEEEKRKEEEEREKRRVERVEEERRVAREREEAEAATARREAARMKASAVDPVARALLASRARIEDAKRLPSRISKGDAEEEEDDDDDAAVVPPASSSSSGGPHPPPALRHVSLVAPANLTPLAVEVIKLTAQYVALSEKRDARGGDNFLTNLTLGEWTNPEFAFLQPRHAHFAYFTALVDGYRSFLPGGEEYERTNAKRGRLAHMITDGPDGVVTTSTDRRDTVRECLEAAAYRAEYEREMWDRRREAAGGGAGADGTILGGSGTVDWHDFVVVETIEFAADEVVEALPPPTSLRLAVLKKGQRPAAMEENAAADEEQEEAEEGMGETEESSSDDDDDDMDMDDDDDDGGGEKLKVVSNYQPKVVSTREITGDASRTHIIDPISGKSIAIADMPEHMRIQLLDPKWAEERKRFLEKQRETNFVAGEDIASNISRFAQARGDIFGSSEADIRDRRADSERRLMEANRLIREQAMQPQPQPLGSATSAAHHVGVPPPPPPPPPPMGMLPPHPPVFAPPPPQPPPPPQQQVIMAQPAIPPEEPTAKRPKIDESQIDPNLAMAPPPPPGIPIAPSIAGPGIDPPQPPLPPPEENELLSESDFIATLSDPDDVPICVRVPHDPSNSNWNFNGQTIDIPAKATTTVKDLKAALKEQLGGMPMNKMQLKHPSSGFMNKDGLSLAFFNVGPMATIDLVPKTRGGRK
ncbi:hypothetical protein ACHAW5_006632 [Stephanodiscus triporus]|uniref:Splicing factor 3A subunit 1 n=1 Tax=Stephanodiscus triporus TaxID=2934178 RepID=A0ABD3N671_9STRA